MVTGFHGQMVKWQKKGFPYCCQVVKERFYECQLWFQLLYWLDSLDAYKYPPICPATGTNKINIPITRYTLPQYESAAVSDGACTVFLHC